MAEKTTGITLREMTLTNIARGNLELQFQTALATITANVFGMPDEYQADKDGNITAAIPMEVRLVRAPDGLVTAYVSANVKPPKRKESGAPVFYEPGVGWSVHETMQFGLFKGAQPTAADMMRIAADGDGAKEGD